MRTLSLLFALLVSQFCFAQNWQPLGSGLDYWTTCLYNDSISDQLIVSGGFSMADTQPVNGITNYDGTFHSMWTGFPSCPSGSAGGSVWVTHRYGSWIYFGGNFNCLGGLNNSNLARWNGTNWDTIPGGGIPFQNGVVRDMTVYNNELYICGTFTSISGVSANQIAKFDGTSWNTVADNYNFNDILSEIIFYHGNMYVAGNIFDPFGNMYRLAMWNGSSWTYFNAPDLSGGVHDLEVYDDELYVSGEIYYGNGSPGIGIIRWNDTIWRDVGGSVQVGSLNSVPVVENMCVHNGKLFCVGNFEMIGGVSAKGIASWDGTIWCGYGASFGGSQPYEFTGPESIAFYRDTLYVSGGFMYIDSLQVNFIAKWVGGTFVDTCGTAVGISDPDPVQNSVSVYPNPTSSTVTFQFSSSQHSRTIFIYDHRGREILHEVTNEASFAISVESFAEGMYFYSVVGENNVSEAGKFVVER